MYTFVWRAALVRLLCSLMVRYGSEETTPRDLRLPGESKVTKLTFMVTGLSSPQAHRHGINNHMKRQRRKPHDWFVGMSSKWLRIGLGILKADIP